VEFDAHADCIDERTLSTAKNFERGLKFKFGDRDLEVRGDCGVAMGPGNRAGQSGRAMELDGGYESEPTLVAVPAGSLRRLFDHRVIHIAGTVPVIELPASAAADHESEQQGEAAPKRRGNSRRMHADLGRRSRAERNEVAR
jgi:hypothetical protein